MALKTLGTEGTTSLWALGAWSSSLSDADIAAIGEGISPDDRLGAILAGYSAGATAVIATGATHTSTLLDTLVGIGGAPLTQIRVGDLVIADQIAPGTFVAAKPTATSVTLSQAATFTLGVNNVLFVRPVPPHLSRLGLLTIPGRGVLKLLPGDIVALDNAGFPILVCGNSVGYVGSQWVLT